MGGGGSIGLAALAGLAAASGYHAAFAWGALFALLAGLLGVLLPAAAQRPADAPA